MSTILKLWDGLLSHEALLCAKMERQDKKEKENEKEFAAYNKFWNSLSAKQKELYRAFERESGDSFCEEMNSAYLQGFRTGALLMMDVLKEE